MLKLFSIIKRIFFHNKVANISLGIALALALLLNKSFLKMNPNETALFYFFSSIAQSMAAIIALAGTVAVFRYSFLMERLRSARNHIKDRFATSEWLYYYGVTDSQAWRDEEVLARAEALINPKFPSAIFKELSAGITELKTLQNFVEKFLDHLQPSAISTSTAFILSIIFIPLSSWMTTHKYGLYAVILFSFLAFITTLNIFDYFKMTTSVGCKTHG